MGDSQSHLLSIAEKIKALRSGRFNQQSGAICYRPSSEHAFEVLLITSLDTGRWVIPKGNIAKKEVGHEAAAREAGEEAGVKGKVFKKPFGYFTYVKTGEPRPCIVSAYLLEVTGVVKRFPEKDKRTLEWVSPAEASRRVEEPELKGLFNRLSQMQMTPSP